MNWILLAYRWSCRMAVCSSCGMVLTASQSWPVKPLCGEYYPQPIRVEPLGNFAIERDLIIDQAPFLAKLESVKPFIIDAGADLKKPANETIQAGEYKQTPLQLAMFKQYSMCINCLLCYSACPQFGLNPQFTAQPPFHWRIAITLTAAIMVTKRVLRF